ncbi:MAG: hypothetical protein HY717_13245 [Planctomycetes bacterium]|nr:hypothetical protein [Planctomycetota bacterium]
MSTESDGAATLRLVAEGTESRYRLSYVEDSLPFEQPEPASVEMEFFIRRKK